MTNQSSPENEPDELLKAAMDDMRDPEVASALRAEQAGQPASPESAEALKPCPFCGSQVALSILEDEPGEIISAWVHCSCGVEIHERRTEAEAAMQWNSRAAPAQQPASPVTEQEQATIAYIVLRAMQAKVNSDTYGVDHALKINAERAGAAAAEIMALRRHAQCAPKAVSEALLAATLSACGRSITIDCSTQRVRDIIYDWIEGSAVPSTDGRDMTPEERSAMERATAEVDAEARAILIARRWLDDPEVKAATHTRPDGGGGNG